MRMGASPTPCACRPSPAGTDISWKPTGSRRPRKPAAGCGAPPSLANSLGAGMGAGLAATTRFGSGLRRVATFGLVASAFLVAGSGLGVSCATARDPRPLSSPRIDSSRNEMSLRPRSTGQFHRRHAEDVHPIQFGTSVQGIPSRGDVAAVDGVEQGIGGRHVGCCPGCRRNWPAGFGARNGVRCRKRRFLRGGAALWSDGASALANGSIADHLAPAAGRQGDAECDTKHHGTETKGP